MLTEFFERSKLLNMDAFYPLVLIMEVNLVLYDVDGLLCEKGNSLGMTDGLSNSLALMG
jgi:hypothetical protein